MVTCRNFFKNQNPPVFFLPAHLPACLPACHTYVRSTSSGSIGPVFSHNKGYQCATGYKFVVPIKTCGSESRCYNKAACIHFFRLRQLLQGVIYMDSNSKIIKCCTFAAVAAIAKLLQT